MLELDRLEKALLPCPLLWNPDSYLPDTVDLTRDSEAREYWLHCFVDSVDKVLYIAEQAIASLSLRNDELKQMVKSCTCFYITSRELDLV